MSCINRWPEHLLVRILLVHNYYQQRGGEDVVVEQERDLLRAKGHDVDLFSVTNDSIRGAWRKATTAVLTVHNPWAAAALADRVRQFRPDVVHVHNFFPQLSPAIFDACRDAGVPSVMTLHNFRIMCPTAILYHNGRIRERSLKHSAIWALWHRVYRASFLATLPLVCMVDFHKCAGTWRRKVDLFIALTDFAKAKFIEGGLAADQIVVKGNAVADPSTGLNVDNTPRHGALYVGRLSDEKGIAVLLSAWRSLDYPLRIAGDGPLREMCEAASSKNITCLGRLSRDQVNEEMRRASFLVLPSICYEMFPMTIVEAFSNGLPVLASDLGGLSSLLQDGAAGQTFTPMDAQDLNAKARWAIEHPDQLANMGKAARAAFEERYTAERNYLDLIAIYERAISVNVHHSR